MLAGERKDLDLLRVFRIKTPFCSFCHKTFPSENPAKEKEKT